MRGRPRLEFAGAENWCIGVPLGTAPRRARAAGGAPSLHVGEALPVVLPELAWVPALIGLYLYEWAYVRAGQLPPLS